jgi:hypothetical protein
VLTVSENPRAQLLLAEIMATLRRRFTRLNHHYEAVWTGSFVYFRCWHAHPTLLDAAKCAAARRVPSWYCFAIEFEMPRELTDAEDAEVRAFRFHTEGISNQPFDFCGHDSAKFSAAAST